MHILHIKYPRSCIRTFKESKMLLDRGHRVDVLASTQGFGFNIYTSAGCYGDMLQLARMIRTSQADILHVHTEPDWLVPFVKKYADGRPVVMDVHDPNSLLNCKPPTPDEVDAFEAADAIIHVSEPCRIHCEDLHGNTKPTMILYSYVNGEFYRQAESVNWKSLVYEGGLTSEISLQPGLVHFRNIQDVVQKFIESGYHVSLFAAGDGKIDLSYETMGALVVRDLTYVNMLNGVRNHAFGFVGTFAPVKLMNAAMPNKLFEYISQGVVPVCWNADTAGEFVQRNGIGIWLKADDDLSDLPDKLSRGPAYRKNLLANRDKWKMETQAEALENFYRSILDGQHASVNYPSMPALEDAQA